jgi:hypothetical protein
MSADFSQQHAKLHWDDNQNDYIIFLSIMTDNKTVHFNYNDSHHNIVPKDDVAVTIHPKVTAIEDRAFFYFVSQMIHVINSLFLIHMEMAFTVDGVTDGIRFSMKVQY